ncbi:hypothetical protein EVAR_20618_1 [Eumeta japonica]|uniref:Uncharacterized protein n=1 Tax=Eumeta variegata TaxID=151549 RepID=A0A4C1US24_EUMVA|nr:hypothetical protein EVAR_20618_1 [Eumeta japonica]
MTSKGNHTLGWRLLAAPARAARAAPCPVAAPAPFLKAARLRVVGCLIDTPRPRRSASRSPLRYRPPATTFAYFMVEGKTSRRVIREQLVTVAHQCYIRNTRGITSALVASWEAIGYLMEDDRPEREAEFEFVTCLSTLRSARCAVARRAQSPDKAIALEPGRAFISRQNGSSAAVNNDITTFDRRAIRPAGAQTAAASLKNDGERSSCALFSLLGVSPFI